MVSAGKAEGGSCHLSMGLAGDSKLRHLGLPGLGGDVQEDWWKAAVPSAILKGETAGGVHGGIVGLPLRESGSSCEVGSDGGRLGMGEAWRSVTWGPSGPGERVSPTLSHPSRPLPLQSH